MSIPIVFVCPADLNKLTPPPCLHHTHIVHPDGYECQECGEELVYCWSCANASITDGVFREHIHILPACDDEPARTCRKDMIGARSRGSR